MERRFVLQDVQMLNGKRLDIVIEQGYIVELTEANTAQGECIPCHGCYVSSGWIDMHVHAFSEFDPYGDVADEVGIKQGVATIIDAGSCGADRFDDFYEQVSEAKTNVLAFLNISSIGLSRKDELSNLAWIDREKARLMITKYKEIIVGLKARMSQSVVCENGIEPLLVAREIAKENHLSLMVHIGSGPPKIEDILLHLEKKDILTHFLNGKDNNLFDEHGRPLPLLMEAVDKGVHLDVGHGGASFSFKVAEFAKRAGIQFQTISSDIYRQNRLEGPVFSLAKVMTKFIALGYSLQEVVDGVTIQAATWLNRPELGRIQVGDKAHLTLFSLVNGPVELIDSQGEVRIGLEEIVAKGVVVNGEYYPCEVRTKTSH
ncbi:amidohydrolase [Alkalihalobacillus alcalophilus ATCC 27647 = CGMCC 1.3604]|uniref:Amidohydrolase n=1 Tax=Alkalihalobacillus alcalophilus ATCC 27647 = CGMCC 1.3604 TaxID=1218173 RepID=A0A094WJU2_ALKAL|nr:amidohydrolase/deacetylase family metallohydrolase [Alkalihalobacillus alcalophilus]KGA97106.1 amidohydrolase [Alkalihalobacillus alcalophilus ATCC 27647 = CGMCC 1.3604]MED1563077.1 amidohydrolase/deacetylase family metallohydrolase [Alkalihalobacillus alcalophilus]THG89844.1 amidohydrolase [Alkalihalobacillus alcalophilus ATCC 27647 = CGMCC 1.3604]